MEFQFLSMQYMMIQYLAWIMLTDKPPIVKLWGEWYENGTILHDFTDNISQPATRVAYDAVEVRTEFVRSGVTLTRDAWLVGLAGKASYRFTAPRD